MNSPAVAVEGASHGRPFVENELGVQRIYFPLLQATGLGPNASLKVDGLRASALSNAGDIDLSGWREGQMFNDGTGLWVSLILPEGALQKIAARPVMLFLTLEMTIEQLEQPIVVRESASEFSVGTMKCSTTNLCRAAVNTVPYYWVVYTDAAGKTQEREIGTLADSTIPTDFSESPVTTLSLEPKYTWPPLGSEPSIAWVAAPVSALPDHAANAFSAGN